MKTIKSALSTHTFCMAEEQDILQTTNWLQHINMHASFFVDLVLRVL